jgi:hypothetical protein
MYRIAPRTFLLSFCLAAVLVATGCGHFTLSTSNSHDTEVQALRDADAAWAQAWASKDVDKAVAGYADDATVLDPNLAAITGRENFRANLKPFFADKNFAIHWDAARWTLRNREIWVTPREL